MLKEGELEVGRGEWREEEGDKRTGVVCLIFEFHILAISRVISGWVQPSCSAHSW